MTSLAEYSRCEGGVYYEATAVRERMFLSSLNPRTTKVFLVLSIYLFYTLFDINEFNIIKRLCQDL